VKLELVGLAVLMFAATYPSRALPLLAPGIERLPAKVLEYLRLVGPACLAALAASNTVLLVDAARQTRLHVGFEALAVLLCIAIVAWRRSLLLGLLAAVGLLAVTRAVIVG
jgi:branched-subunit amino acid transport protein